tara:strand:- start:14485 stop:14634 length:150 start_codon:yes stop_codon:yes gene_type:complete
VALPEVQVVAARELEELEASQDSEVQKVRSAAREQQANARPLGSRILIK